MLTKYRLHTLGFDDIDKTKIYQTFLSRVSPLVDGPSTFRAAYATGMGLMMNYTLEYISEADIESPDFKKPQFLHFVIGFEKDVNEKDLSKDDILQLQA